MPSAFVGLVLITVPVSSRWPVNSLPPLLCSPREGVVGLGRFGERGGVTIGKPVPVEVEVDGLKEKFGKALAEPRACSRLRSLIEFVG